MPAGHTWPPQPFLRFSWSLSGLLRRLEKSSEMVVGCLYKGRDTRSSSIERASTSCGISEVIIPSFMTSRELKILCQNENDHYFLLNFGGFCTFGLNFGCWLCIIVSQTIGANNSSKGTAKRLRQMNLFYVSFLVMRISVVLMCRLWNEALN